MPSSIPYDPSITLANVVDKDALANLTNIAKASQPVDAAQNHLNALLAMRRSFDMTRNELLNLGIDTKSLNDELEKLNIEITGAAGEYVNQKIKAEAEIKPLRSNMKGVNAQVESPVDLVKSQIKYMPLASDSLNMDVQYFSLDTNKQDSDTFSSAIGTFVAASTSWMGNKASAEMSKAAKSQVSSQTQKHSISGTLVLSVSCTHKNAAVLAPFVLNVDKAIGVWNSIYPKSRLDPTNRGAMAKLAKEDDPTSADKYSIVSGTTFGSSFVGMVHVLNSTSTNVTQSMSSMASTLQAQMDAGSWLEASSGGFGINSSLASDVKNLISTQNVTTHVTLLCMGHIPSMVASEVKLGVQTFAQFDPKSSMEAIATIQNATSADQGSFQQSAEAARTGQKMVAMKSSEIKATLSALAEIDDGNNKLLDINSMMSALDDYLKKAAEGTSGVPLNYYLKDITKIQLAQMWVAKYYPGEYLAIKYDDAENEQSGGSGNSGSGET